MILGNKMESLMTQEDTRTPNISLSIFAARFALRFSFVITQQRQNQKSKQINQLGECELDFFSILFSCVNLMYTQSTLYVLVGFCLKILS